MTPFHKYGNMGDKLNKMLIVIFLTLLIWTWAYLSQEKPAEITGTLQVAESTDPGLLVTFSLSGSKALKQVPLPSISLKGTPSKLSKFQEKYHASLSFYYDPAEQNKTEGNYTLNLVEYLQKSNKITDYALTVKSCMPSEVDVTTEPLVEKKIPIQCLDENGFLIKEAEIKPAFASIYVRKGYDGSATVLLTKQQIENARKEAVRAVPYVELGIADAVREANQPVEVVLKSETLLKPRTFKTPKPIGIFMSEKLQNAYKVTILNDEKIRETMLIYATDEAFRAYENTTYPLYIIIKDSDVVDLSKIPPKTIYYNFPPEYVKSGEIAEDETKLPRTADIKIEVINSTLTQ